MRLMTSRRDFLRLGASLTLLPPFQDAQTPTFSTEVKVNGAADLGVELEPHIALCVEAMRGIAGELGLDGSAAKTA